MTEFHQVQEPRKLYVLTRSDLSPGLQLAQAVHAGTQFVMDFTNQAYDWEEKWKNLICLAVRDEDELLRFMDIIDRLWPVYAAFREPDINNEWTSLAVLAPESFSRKYFSNLPLSLRSLPLQKGGEA